MLSLSGAGAASEAQEGLPQLKETPHFHTFVARALSGSEASLNAYKSKCGVKTFRGGFVGRLPTKKTKVYRYSLSGVRSAGLASPPQWGPEAYLITSLKSSGT